MWWRWWAAQEDHPLYWVNALRGRVTKRLMVKLQATLLAQGNAFLDQFIKYNGISCLLDVHEAAAMLAVKVSTLRQWTYQRRIPVVKLLGRAVRFRESDLRHLIDEWTQAPLRG